MAEEPRIALLCNNKMALPSLQSLHNAGVLCSVCTADNDPEIVKLFGQTARQLQIPYFNTGRKNLAENLNGWVKSTRPDVVYVITFPWRLPVEILTHPRYGFINFHYGLLPEMRGADPIFESIRLGMPSAGVTAHVMDADLDTGPIIYREQLPLPPEYTYGMLSSQLAQLGNQMCLKVTNELKTGKFPEVILQDETKAVYHPRVSEQEITIKWNEMDLQRIMALVRSCNPVAKGTPALINGWKIGICDVSEVNLQGDASAIVPGTILAMDPQNGLIVCCMGGKAVKLEVVYTAEGVFPGFKLDYFGISPGMVFG